MRYWRIAKINDHLNDQLFDEGYPYIYGGSLCNFGDDESVEGHRSKRCAGNLSQIDVGDAVVVGGFKWCYYVGRAISKPMYVFKKYGPYPPDTPFMDADQDTINKFREHKTDPTTQLDDGRRVFHDVACVKTVWSVKRPDEKFLIDGIADGHGKRPPTCSEITNPDAIRKINELLGQTEINQTDRTVNMEDNSLKAKLAAMLKQVKNIILTGAPGTGKTHLAKQIAMQITGANSEEELEKSGQFAFVQFHPSYDYTDFVEGLRPKKETEQKEIGFELKNGIFKEFCERAKKACFEQSGGVDNFDEAWGKFTDAVEEKCENGEIYDKAKTLRSKEMRLSLTDSGVKRTVDDKINAFLNREQCYKVYRGLPGIPQGGHDNYRKAIIKRLKEFFGLEDFSEGTAQTDISNAPKYIFVIDEINRGEISKIFGELFFSIDPSYRGISGAVKTQYSNMHNDEAEKFYVPENVYIIGTMNDIDRSVESFDFAMRRRFTWVEITAKESQKMFNGEEWKDEAIAKMDRLNNAIENIDNLNTSYHIGGAYFKNNLPKYEENERFNKLWEYHLKPLLKEYLRGMPDAETRLAELEKAYEPNSGKTDIEKDDKPMGDE